MFDIITFIKISYIKELQKYSNLIIFTSHNNFNKLQILKYIYRKS